MKKKIFYISCKDTFFINLAAKLKLKNNWNPVYWTGNKNNKEQILKEFPKITFETNIYRIRGYVPKNLQTNFDSFISPIQKLKLNKLKKISTYMLERFNFENSFTKNEKIEIINHHIKYSDYITDLKKPDMVIFQEVPHFIFDYIMYEICKIKKIETFMFAYSNFNGYSYIRKSIFSNPPNLTNKNFDIDKIIKFQDDYDRIKNKNKTDQTPKAEKWIQKKIKFESKELNISNKIYRALRDYKIFWTILRKIFMKNDITSAGHIKLKNKSFLTFPTYLQQFLYIKKAEKLSSNLKSKYRSLCKEPDLEKNYISFFLHYEPERATSPQCGLLYDQIQNIINISKILPDNYYLYVKEHYKTFLAHTMSRRQCRKIEDYLKILENKKVTLIDDRYTSNKLIQNTKCVITGVGTVGSESLINLKPVMTFGYSWINAFPYTLSMRSKFKLKESLKKIINNQVKFSEQDVKEFLERFSNINFKMQHTSTLRSIDPNLISEEDNIDTMFKALDLVSSKNISNKI